MTAPTHLPAVPVENDCTHIAEALRPHAVPIDSLAPDPANLRLHGERNLEAIQASLVAFGQQKPIVTDSLGVIVAGNGMYEAAKLLGWSHVAAVRTDLAGVERVAYAIADNRTAELSTWDNTALAKTLKAIQEDNTISTLVTGFTDDDIRAIVDRAMNTDLSGIAAEQARGGLCERFIVPPFSVLDSRRGYWQERKRLWLALGIESDSSRDSMVPMSGGVSGADPDYYRQKEKAERKAGLTLSHEEFEREYYQPPNSRGSSMRLTSGGGLLSIFDPVICELAYRWFVPAGGAVLDPFSGGSVRGIVASVLGLRYTGVDLRPDQVEANRVQAHRIHGDVPPVWVAGDSMDIRRLAPGEYDFVFSCPPYADLEVYSDDPRDISNMDYPAFLAAYRRIIAESVSMLKPGRFACFVVGNVRDAKGFYRDFVGDTVTAFHSAGATLYNEAVLVNPIGSLIIRAAKPFQVGRKLGKTHQNTLVFFKGDPQTIRSTFPSDIEFGDPGEEMVL